MESSSRLMRMFYLMNEHGFSSLLGLWETKNFVEDMGTKIAFFIKAKTNIWLPYPVMMTLYLIWLLCNIGTTDSSFILESLFPFVILLIFGSRVYLIIIFGTSLSRSQIFFYLFGPWALLLALPNCISNIKLSWSSGQFFEQLLGLIHLYVS